MRDDDFFWEGARAGKLLLQKCGTCQTLRHPPLPMCPACQSLATTVVQCSGRGEVLGWVSSKHPTRPDPDERIVVQVKLDEGICLISNIQDVALEAIEAGMPVEVFFQSFGALVLPQFRPVGPSAQ